MFDSEDHAAVRDALIPALAEGGYDAVALCLLSAYVAPAHELRLEALIREVIPEVPEWLCRIVEKLHAKNPAERPQNYEEWRQAFDTVMNSLR